MHSLEKIFSGIVEGVGWRGGRGETVCGSGSTMAYTARLRYALEFLIMASKWRVVIDAACGDFYWFSQMSLPGVVYIGVDIVGSRIRKNVDLHGSVMRHFFHGDICSYNFPHADVVICRDCIMHLPDALIFKFLHNFIRSGIPNLLITSHPGAVPVDLVKPGGYRPVDLMVAPFGFGAPILHIDDFPLGFGLKKWLALWGADQVRSAILPAPEKVRDSNINVI